MGRAWGLAIGAAALLTGGCHAKFKKVASSLDAVHPQVISVATAPSITLGGTGNAVLDVVNGVRALDVAQKLSRQVALDQVNDAFQAGVAETLGAGPPFALTEDDEAPTLQVEVTNYGLIIPTMGGPGTFGYDLRVRIYQPDGERVYRTSLSCQVPIGGANAISQVLGTRDNLGNVLEMRRKEVQGAFDDAADQCGRQLVTQIRRHAS